MPINRRQFLATATSAALFAGARRARAGEVSAADRKFIFVVNPGGWDPTRVFAGEFGNSRVAMESSATTATRGGITHVSHPSRPSVDTFFSAWHDRCLVLNGMLVRAISHDLCAMLTLTGSTTGTAPDWPAILAAADAERYPLPHLVLGGPNFAGDLGALVARSGLNGQLDGLLTGTLAAASSDISVPAPTTSTITTIDRCVQEAVARRVARALGGTDTLLAEAYAVALDKANGLRLARNDMSFAGGGELSEQASVAASALSTGLSRCVTVAFPADPYAQNWDSHVENDSVQSDLWEELFAELSQLMDILRATPGTTGRMLDEETTVVVFSEMGRTPNLNQLDGKDHWPYGSAMLIGGGFTGDRVIGGFDDYFYGDLIDPASGESTTTGEVLGTEMLGATLLKMADVDPEEWVPGMATLDGVLT